MSDFERMLSLNTEGCAVCEVGEGRLALASELGARVFCELSGQSLHRLDVENVLERNRPFNNYGGNTLWPAPEGGLYGFNYQGDTWRVQKAINDEPFVLVSARAQAATAQKRVILVTRREVELEVVMERRMRVVEMPNLVADLGPITALSYEVDDKIEVVNAVAAADALIACWTLEQFDARDGKVSFARVEGGCEAINFDFYEHPEERIVYGRSGFVYRTDGRQAGQIGLKKKARAAHIGFWDAADRLLCVRQIVCEPPGKYFNIADNDQPDGPWSAADEYSIYNSSAEQGFFELETIGGAVIEKGELKGSQLSSRTTFALFEAVEPLAAFLDGVVIEA